MIESAETSDSRGRTLIWVHGHGFKPDPEALWSVWMEAIRSGLNRDIPAKLTHFNRVNAEAAYYGDLTNQFLSSQGAIYDEQLDLVDLRNALASLKALDKRKKFSCARYDRLPGKSALKEFTADVTASLLGPLGLLERIIKEVAPEMVEYWDPNSDYGHAVRERITAPLLAAMDRGDSIMLLSHGMGTVCTYDALWRLSRDQEFQHRHADGKVDVWITLGCPLGNQVVRKRLLGAKEPGATRYPKNVLTWYNVAAEDDYMGHDKTVANDYSAMLSYKLVSRIQDHHIYNLAVRYGKSEPHSSVGYLVHPRVAELIAYWLPEAAPQAE